MRQGASSVRGAPGEVALEPGQWWRGPLLAGAIGLLLTAPHWLKNAIWYGDPVFPYLHPVLGSRWPVEAHELFEYWFKKHEVAPWQPKGTTLLARLGETGALTVGFSFKPHDWSHFHGKVPVFGSLFTLLLPVLALARQRSRALIGLVVAAHMAVFIWYWTLHQDRYLQIAVPWMAAATAALLTLAWRSHPFARVGVVTLVGVQIIWGGDAPFIPAHAMCTSSIKKAVDLLGQGYKKNYESRLDWSDSLNQLDQKLPEDATVLLHEVNPRLGVFRPVVSDFAPSGSSAFATRASRTRAPCTRSSSRWA